MIFWKDFAFDDVIGPVLTVEWEPVVSRGKQFGDPSVMEDAINKRGISPVVLEEIPIQETRQEKRPARMVGLSSLDSAQNDKDVGRAIEQLSLRRRGGV